MVSREEQRNDCRLAMGADLGAMYCDLNEHLLDIILLWEQYKHLFSDNPESIKALNSSAPFFFRIVQVQFWDAVILGISRLNDPATQGRAGHKNLSIHALPSLINEPGVQDNVKKAIENATVAARFARDHRDKRIAHNDLSHIQEGSVNPLPRASSQDIQNALDSICAVLEIVSSYYCKCTILYDRPVVNGGVEGMVRFLKRGLGVSGS